MAVSTTCTDLLHNFIEKLQLVIEQIRDVESSRDICGEFKHEEFWNKISAMFKKASHEATTLSLVFSKAPSPTVQECDGILESIEKTVIAIVSVYYSFPNTQGMTVKNVLKKAVLNIIEGIKSLAEALEHDSTGSQQQLQTTGGMWQDAEIVSSLPKNNREAVLTVVDESSSLVKDALIEIEELRTGEDDELDGILGVDDSAVLSNSEKALLAPCSGLIKTSKFILKKTSEGIKSNVQNESKEFVIELDNLTEIVDRLSPAVDNFASSLYPPIKHDSIKEEGKQLYQTNEALLTFLNQHVEYTLMSFGVAKIYYDHNIDPEFSVVLRQSQLKTEKLDALLAANKHNWKKISSSLDAV